MERQFTIKSWEYVVKKFDLISKRKSYVLRFRIDYYSFVFGISSRKDHIRKFFFNILGFISQIRYVFAYQMKKSVNINPSIRYLVHLSDNSSFLKTILPICNILVENNCAVVFLCPANHYFKLKSSLDPEFVKSLYRYEEIHMYKNRITVVYKIFSSLVLSIVDMLWFSCTNLKGSFSTAVSFGRHSFVHYFSDKFWIQYFNENQKIYVSAADQYLWEAALFSNIKETISLSFVFQHGKMSDIYYPTLAKYFCAFGSVDYYRMVGDFHAFPSEIINTGSPCFDIIYNRYRESGLNEVKSKKYVSFFAQPWYRISVASLEHYLSALDWFYQLSSNKTLGHIEFVIKLHPKDDIGFYNSRPSNVKIISENLLSILEKSFVSLTLDSSMIFESAFCRVPCIQTMPLGEDVFTDISSSGICLRVSSYAELEYQILELLQNKSYCQKIVSNSENSIHQYFSNLGHSLSQIIELLKIENGQNQMNGINT